MFTNTALISNKAFKLAHHEEVVPFPGLGHGVIPACTVPALTVTLTLLVSANFKSKLCGLTELLMKGLLEQQLSRDHAHLLMSLLWLHGSSYFSPWIKPTMAVGAGDHGTGWQGTAAFFFLFFSFCLCP